MNEVLESKSEGHRDLVNLADSYGRTGLMVACKHGHIRLAQSLIQKGADVSAVDRGGSSALLEAVKHGKEILLCLRVIFLVLLMLFVPPRLRSYPIPCAPHFRGFLLFFPFPQ